MLKNLKIGQRLGLAFGLVLALLAATAALGINSMGQIQSRLLEITHVNNQETRLAVAMRIAVNQVARATRDIVLLKKADDLARTNDALKASRQKYDDAEAKLGAMFTAEADTTAKEKELFARIKELKLTTRPLNSKVFDLAGQQKTDEATAMLMGEVEPAQRQWLRALGELADFEDKLNEDAAVQAAAAYSSARMLMLALAAAAMVCGIVAAWLITRSVTGPINHAARVAQTVAAGDLTSVFPPPTRDETGTLLAALKVMNEGLVGIVASVRSGSDSIATGSSQIAAGNADLSQRTEEQASNLQQTAASMEQLSSTVKHNSSTAQEANRVASGATQAAAEGGRVVGQVVQTMQDISASSKKISDIIGVIDGIAFQTNILALNAAVEAARAGEQGRGFAVVASEVRSLAQRSAGAAKEIKTLIGESVARVDTGAKLVDDAGKSMDDIVGQVRRVSELITEISNASIEQTQGIGQIGDAVNQLDQVTQRNAALVEESAAAADSLSQQASKLAAVVGVFKLDATQAAGAQGGGMGLRPVAA